MQQVSSAYRIQQPSDTLWTAKDHVMPNGRLRYLIAVAVLATGIALNAIWGWSNSRASDDDVEEVSAATKYTAARLEKHEREASATFTKILVNQSAIATSIDFLVAKEDPRRMPIAPTIEAPVMEAEVDD